MMKLTIIFLTIFIGVVVGEGKASVCKKKTTKNVCCKLPFIYKGKSYSDCTNVDHTEEWCSTTSNYDKDGKWGICKGCKDYPTWYNKHMSMSNYKKKCTTWKKAGHCLGTSAKYMTMHCKKTCGLCGKCSPPKEVLNAVHNNCLGRWTNMFSNPRQIKAGTVTKLENVCPSFCRHVGENCVWDIACKRCKNLLKICRANVPFCKFYIQRNENRQSDTRCPQYEYCSTSTKYMTLIRNACYFIYGSWQLEDKKGTEVADLSDPCLAFCTYRDVDCAWRIMCRKCLLLVKLKKDKNLKTMMQAKFNAIIAKGYKEHCSVYYGKIIPFWYFHGDWV